MSVRMIVAALVSAPFLMLATGAAASEGEINLAGPQGALLGQMSADGKVAQFKGLPYAVPPVGVRRWTAAQPAPGWTGVRDARHFAPICMQAPMPPELTFGPGKTQPVIYAEPAAVMSEDCLYLNVWTPSADKARKAPVMVWIHGGGFVGGGANTPSYDGAALARKGVVVVSLNYRLGVFGFFAHPEISAGAGPGPVSNFAITDQVEALKWVKANVAAFGGDPDNVTIFGESAGSWAVSLLMATPLSQGLFHKAIGQSGAYLYSMPSLASAASGLPSAESTGKAFGDRVAPGGLAALRALSAQALLDKTAFAPGIPNFGQFLTVDGAVFKRPVRETFLRGEQHAVPVMVGFNADEGSGLSDFGVVAQTPGDAASYEAQVTARFGDLAPAYLKQYPSGDLTDAVFDAYRDSEFGWRMEHWADRMAAVKSPAWLYYFSHVPPTGEARRWVSFGADQRKLGAFHASEIAYVFNNPGVQFLPGQTVRASDLALSQVMSDYWVAFARSGDPNGGARPVWSPYRGADRRYMAFDGLARPSVNLLPGSLELHRAIDERRARLAIPWDGVQAGLLGHAVPLPPR